MPPLSNLDLSLKDSHLSQEKVMGAVFKGIERTVIYASAAWISLMALHKSTKTKAKTKENLLLSHYRVIG